jgi:hypothetical protein
VRKVFAVLAGALVLVIVIQFFLAASGAFDAAPNDESFQPHRALGYGALLLAVVLTVVAALARMPGRLIGMCGLIAGLVLVQGLIRAVADAFDDAAVIFGLHGINALVILALAGTVARRARALARTGRAAQPAS